MSSLSRFRAPTVIFVKALLVATAIFLATPAYSQAGAANFGNVSLCGTDQAGSSSCTKSLPFVLTVPFGPAEIQVLTEGVPNLDFSAISPQCSGTKPVICSLGVNFSPRYAGLRRGAIQVVNTESGTVMATRFIYGMGVGPQIGFGLSTSHTVGSSKYQGNALAVDAGGNVYIGGNKVIKINPSGSQTTLASGLATTGLAVDGAGDLLVGDGVNHQVLSISRSGTQTTLTNNFLPGALAVDGAGDIYVINQDVPEILLLKSDGSSSIIDKNVVHYGLGLDSEGLVVTDNSYDLERLNSNSASPTILFPGYYADPGGIAIDAAENVFGIVQAAHTLLAITPGTNSTDPISNSIVGSAAAVSLDDSGNPFYLTNNGVITETDRSATPTLSFTIGDASPQALTIDNNGNALMTLSSISIPVGFSPAPNTDGAEVCAIGVTLQPGQSCAISISSGGKLYPAGKAVDVTYTGGHGSFTRSVPLQTTLRTATFNLTGTWDSSDYATSNQSLTVKVTTPSNMSPVPTGTVTFQSNGSVLQGCSGIALSGGTASCNFTPISSFKITVVYSGDSTYGSVSITGPKIDVRGAGVCKGICRG